MPALVSPDILTVPDIAKRSRNLEQVMEEHVEAMGAQTEGTTYETGGLE